MTAWAFCLRLLYRVVRATVGTGQGDRAYHVSQSLQFVHCRRVEDRPFAVRTTDLVDNKVRPSSPGPVIARIRYRLAQDRYLLALNILHYRVIRQPVQRRLEQETRIAWDLLFLKPPYSVSCREGSIKYRCGCGVQTLPVPCHDTQALQNCNLTERRIILVIHYTSRSMVDPLPAGHCLQLYSVATLLDKKKIHNDGSPLRASCGSVFIVRHQCSRGFNLQSRRTKCLLKIRHLLAIRKRFFMLLHQLPYRPELPNGHIMTLIRRIKGLRRGL